MNEYSSYGRADFIFGIIFGVIVINVGVIGWYLFLMDASAGVFNERTATVIIVVVGMIFAFIFSNHLCQMAIKSKAYENNPIQPRERPPICHSDWEDPNNGPQSIRMVNP